MRTAMFAVSALAAAVAIGCAHERPRAAVAPPPQQTEPPAAAGEPATAPGTAPVTTVTETTSVTVVRRRRPPPASVGNGINGVDGANYGGESTSSTTHEPP